MNQLQTIIKAQQPLTLAGVPAGFLPWLAADLARAAFANGGRAVLIAADEAALRALADSVPLFAPEVSVLTLPGWDCLPYDRASPALRVMAERLAALNALAGEGRWTAAADRHRQRGQPASASTPFRVRQLTRRIAEGDRLDREALIGQLSALGYQRTDVVAEHGEYAVRGSLLDLYPSGAEQALRLDFFGDEIESLRRFDPADQRSTDKAGSFTLVAGVRSVARRGKHQALPLALPRDVRRQRHTRPALPGGVGRAADGRDGALAAVARRQARDPVRPSRRQRT